jgi:hypothetical protein
VAGDNGADSRAECYYGGGRYYFGGCPGQGERRSLADDYASVGEAAQLRGGDQQAGGDGPVPQPAHVGAVERDTATLSFFLVP